MKRTYLFNFAMIFFLLDGALMANVLVTNITAEPGEFTPGVTEKITISYRLNEAADNGVLVRVYDSGDLLVKTLTGTTTRGVNTVEWMGKNDAGENVAGGEYYFVVEASDDGYDDWTRISMDEAGNTMWNGRGIAVNKNPESSYYGVVYIANTSKGTSDNPGSVLQWDGVYGYWPDGSSFGTYIDTTNFSTSSSNSPYRVTVGDNDKIYLGDNSDGWENVWQVDGDLDENTLVQILARDDDVSGTDPAGNHGNVLTAIMKGTGDNQVLYTTDEDMNDYDVWTFNVGTGPFPWATAGDTIITESDSLADVWDFDIDAAGDFLYGCDDQDPPSFLNPNVPPTFAKFDLSQNPATVVWSSPTTETVHNVLGIGIYEPEGWLAGSAYNTTTDVEYNIFIMDMNTGALLDTILNPGGGSNRDVAFDAVGNLYTVNSSIEWWRVYSPPGGSNSTSLKSTFTVNVVTSVENSPESATPHTYALHQSYPNPFNPRTTISFSVAQPGYVSLIIYDMLGGEVATLVEKELSAGDHSFTWNATGQASGTYIYRLVAGDYSDERKMIYVK